MSGGSSYLSERKECTCTQTEQPNWDVHWRGSENKSMGSLLSFSWGYKDTFGVRHKCAFRWLFVYVCTTSINILLPLPSRPVHKCPEPLEAWWKKSMCGRCLFNDKGAWWASWGCTWKTTEHPTEWGLNFCVLKNISWAALNLCVPAWRLAAS